MTVICFVDTETTSLRHDRRAWEVAVIRREPGKDDAEHQWFVDADDLDLGNADLNSLKIGRFFDRHPQQRLDRECLYSEYHDERDVMAEFEAITRGAHLVGAVPNFDSEVMGNRMRRHGICSSWHYHLIDAETLAVGYLSARMSQIEQDTSVSLGIQHAAIAPPWKSDELAAALGLRVSEDERHTAMGDARFARAIYDAVMAA